MQTVTSPYILAYSPNRTSCNRLITTGAVLAKEQGCPLAFLFVQPRELVSKTVAEDIQTVHDIASREKAEVTVLFSNEPLLSLAIHTRQTNVVQLIVDESDSMGKHTVAALRTLLPDLPLTVLQTSGKIVTFPPIEITMQNHRPHPTPVP